MYIHLILDTFQCIYLDHGRSQDFFGRGTLFENFQKYFLRKLRKMQYFSIFFKKFNKPRVNFLRVWTKNAKCSANLRIFEENSIEKWNFLFVIFIYFYFLEILLLKIEASEITSFFYNNFFGSRGVPPLPVATPLPWIILIKMEIF